MSRLFAKIKRVVVSEEGAAIKVTRLDLPEELQKLLTVDIEQFPVDKK